MRARLRLIGTMKIIYTLDRKSIQTHLLIRTFQALASVQTPMAMKPNPAT
jgi:hypothetical protein